MDKLLDTAVTVTRRVDRPVVEETGFLRPGRGGATFWFTLPPPAVT